MFGLDLNIKISYACLVLRRQLMGTYIGLFGYVLSDQLCRKF